MSPQTRFCLPLTVLLVFLLAISGFITPKTWAAEKQEAQETEVHKTEEVTVKARQIEERLSAELEAYGHPVAVITSQQIEEGGYNDIHQVLNALVPSLYTHSFAAGPGDYGRIQLHGREEVLILLDGVRITNRLYSTSYIDIISPNLIDRIEVLYGGEGLFYGTEATSGVINIVTKPVTKKLSMEFGAAYGQYQHRDLHAHVSETIDGHGFMVFGSNDAWEGYQPYSNETLERFGNTRRETRAYNRTNLGVKYRREFDIAGRGLLRFQYQRDYSDNGSNAPYQVERYNNRTQNLAILKWDHDINKHFSYYFKTYYHDWWSVHSTRDLDGNLLFDNSDWGYQDWGVNAMGSFRFGGGQEVLAGVDYQNYVGDARDWNLIGENQQLWSLFAQYRPYLPFAPFIKSALGARYNKSDAGDKLIWNISARGEFDGGLYARAVAGTSYILPNGTQLYADAATYTGNPDLEPEESTNLDVGLGFKREFFFVEAGYFYQEIENLIVLAPTGGDRSMYKNVDEGEVKGFDLMAGVGPFHGFSVKVSYTNQEVTQGDTGKQLDTVPEYMWKGILSWRHDLGSSKVGADLTGRYIGKVMAYDTDYGEYWLADLSLFCRFGKVHQHMITVRVENLFDEQYYPCLGRRNDASGQRFVYGYEGIPFNVMVGYTFYF
jgi:outer membrane cobalamin receptor